MTPFEAGTSLWIWQFLLRSPKLDLQLSEQKTTLFCIESGKKCLVKSSKFGPETNLFFSSATVTGRPHCKHCGKILPLILYPFLFQLKPRRISLKFSIAWRLLLTLTQFLCIWGEARSLQVELSTPLYQFRRELSKQSFFHWLQFLFVSVWPEKVDLLLPLSFWTHA